MAERWVADRQLQAHVRDAVPAGIRNNLSDECIVLLEELIRSNQVLAGENEKLRQQQERTNKANTEAL